ncbi:MAG: hypothetical protein A4E53_02695 [Pelotomaculum sp. PtaB.Bin104]|nr:MAG: hypothetical protein A4E53_02695 [Pelotomaculum sp. PtaB.Bin104]
MISLLFGWPAILGSLLISTLGISKHRPHWLIAGAILSLGFALYLIGLPAIIFKIAGFLLPTLHIAAMFFVRAGESRVAGMLLLPQTMIAVYLGIIVFTQ